jgi:hypothetical protein
VVPKFKKGGGHFELRRSTDGCGICSTIAAPRCRLRPEIVTRYRLASDWQSQEPGTSTAHWELWWDDDLVTFRAQLFMDYSPGELPDDLRLPSDDDPVSSHGERAGEFLEVDQLTTAMEEEIPGDLVAKL